MPHRPTPVPNLRHPEWLDRARRQIAEQVSPRNRLRTLKRVLRTLAVMLAIAFFKEAWHLAAIRLDWEPPPPRSGERMGSDHVSR
jgi:hypothetical protein